MGKTDQVIHKKPWSVVVFHNKSQKELLVQNFNLNKKAKYTQ